MDDEWLLADGAGGFAMGPAGGPPFRRYHAWLVAAADPPLRRTLLLRGAAEWWEPVGPDGRRIDLAPMRFAADDGVGGVRPGPITGPAATDLAIGADGRSVAWATEAGGLRSHRRLAIGEGAVSLTWRIVVTAVRGDDTAPGAVGADGPAGHWCLRPFTPLRSFHHLEAAGDPPPEAEPLPDGVRLRRDDVVAELRVAAAGGGYRDDPQWWHRFALPLELDRGQDWLTDAWSPGVVRVPLAAGRPVEVRLSMRLLAPWTAEPVAPPAAAEGRSAAAARPARPAGPARPASAAARLDTAAAAYVVRREDRLTVIAGYPWFADWGRDTMISLPGLLPPGERDADAVRVLAAMAAHRRDGLLPNCFLDDAAANDHAADTGPWFLRTLATYASAPGGDARIADAGLLEAAADVVEAVARGTRHGIRLDGDGLVTAGEPGGPAVTWMDAMRGGRVFTPRHGKAVEINGLWIEGLQGLAAIDADRTRAARFRDLAARAADGFAAFAWPERGCLADRIGRRDAGDAAAPVDRPVRELRPNQLIAAACPSVPLDRSARAGVVAACRSALLTPFGLRTLEPDDAAYVGRYEGDLLARDAAYHQGTVWPWLIGPFVDASLLAADSADPEARRAAAGQARRDLEPLLATLETGCRGHLAEVYDGDPPHRPDGCPAQAWSVAEVRRALRRVATILG